MKRPDVINPDERGKESCKTVSRVFTNRLWVTEVWETIPNSKEDTDGYDMFVRAKSAFLRVVRLGGSEDILPVQIKSSERRVRHFIHKHTKQMRFFNPLEKDHEFVLCGMDEEDLVLADIVGQIVVHTSRFGMTERKALNCLLGFGDSTAVAAYERNKVLLLFRWYGSQLPPLN